MGERLSWVPCSLESLFVDLRDPSILRLSLDSPAVPCKGLTRLRTLKRDAGGMAATAQSEKDKVRIRALHLNYRD